MRIYAQSHDDLEPDELEPEESEPDEEEEIPEWEYWWPHNL